MTTRLLQTKLRMPLLRKDLVPRASLLERLNEGFWEGNGFTRRLTLVAAPAGYGKTTLVIAWLRDSPYKVAWLSLEENDNDPTRFLVYLITALQQVKADFGGQVESMLRSPQPPESEIILTALTNELMAIEEPCILVLDDYHLVHDPEIHHRLAFLIDHLPGKIHLVITTREDPLLPLARLRARGQLLEIRQADLRFSLQETSDFLDRVMGLDLALKDIAALEQRTEGWIAGLQLAAISLRGHTDVESFIKAFTGSNRYILDYLVEEVVQHQTVELQDFLIRTSIFGRLSGPLCDAVLERTGSQQELEALEQANLFIEALDQSRSWFRYHRLFADLLYHRLGTDPNLETVLHARASQWFESHDFGDEAVHHAIKAADWERVSFLIRRVSADLMGRGEIGTLIGWYHLIPQEILISKPRFGFDFSWALLLAGQFEQAAPLLNRAEKTAQSDPEFLGRILAAQAYHARGVGDHPRMVAMSERSLALLPADATADRVLVALNLGIAYWHMGRLTEAEKALTVVLDKSRASGNLYASLTALIFQGRILAVRGSLQRARLIFEQAIQQGGQVPINALAHLDLGGLLYERNELEPALEHIGQAIALAERGRNVEFQLGGLMLLVRLHLARGDHGMALQAMEKIRQLIREEKVPGPTAVRVPTIEVLFALAQGELAGAGQWEDQLVENVDAHTFCRFVNLTRARLMIARGELQLASEYLAGLYETAAQAGWGYCQVAVRVLQALAARDQHIGVAFLEEALTLAGDEGFVRIFVDAGAALEPLLQESALQGTRPDTIRKILAGLGERPQGTKADSSSIVEPLSGRELEVLRLIAVGLSNREIAAKLVISLGTAKTHVHNVCAKLGVRNRTEAAMRANELGLV